MGKMQKTALAEQLCTLPFSRVHNSKNSFSKCVPQDLLGYIILKTFSQNVYATISCGTPFYKKMYPTIASSADEDAPGEDVPGEDAPEERAPE